jgi:hypothetical protein
VQQSRLVLGPQTSGQVRQAVVQDPRWRFTLDAAIGGQIEQQERVLGQQGVPRTARRSLSSGSSTSGMSRPPLSTLSM